MINGQILQNSSFGQHIRDIIHQYKPSNIVEIGTWKGMGSTKCIIDEIIKNHLIDTTFISIESNYNFYLEAISNLKNYLKYVKIIHGKIIEINDVLNFCKNNKHSIDINPNWLVADLYNLLDTNNVLSDLPLTIDFLLLDGGEYSTYAEWQCLKDRTHIVALDDIKETKTKQIHNELLLDVSYKNLITSDDRNGYSTFVKISLDN